MVRKYEKHDYTKNSFRFECRIFSDEGTFLCFLTADHVVGSAVDLFVTNKHLSPIALCSEIERFLLRFNKVVSAGTLEDERLLF